MIGRHLDSHPPLGNNSPLGVMSAGKGVHVARPGLGGSVVRGWVRRSAGLILVCALVGACGGGGGTGQSVPNPPAPQPQGTAQPGTAPLQPLATTTDTTQTNQQNTSGGGGGGACDYPDCSDKGGRKPEPKPPEKGGSEVIPFKP